MNPPPLPPTNEENNSIAHLAAKASLVIVPLVFGLSAIGRMIGGANAIIDLIAGVLIVAGFVAAIIALAGIPAYGNKGLLGRGLVGLIINLIFLIIFTINFSEARRKAEASRAAWQQIKASSEDARSDLKKSFDPKKGITNVDLGQVNKLRDGLKNASQNLSGDDASLANAMSVYLDKMQSALTNYQASVTKLREAHVLQQFDPADKDQFAPRRDVVQQFLDSNSRLEQVISHSEDIIRAELISRHVPNSKIEDFIAGYHKSAAPKTVLTMQIRQCDDRLGASMLDALNTLETQMGHWKVNPTTQQLLFEDPDTRTTYNNSIIAIRTIASEQLKLQGELVNRPSAQP